MLVEKICTRLSRPAFEVKTWPASELHFWSVVFSVEGDAKNGKLDKYIEKDNRTPDTVSLEESKQSFRELFD